MKNKLFLRKSLILVLVLTSLATLCACERRDSDSPSPTTETLQTTITDDIPSEASLQLPYTSSTYDTINRFIKIPIMSADGFAPMLGFIYSYADRNLTKIFSNEDLDTYTYTVNYKDNYIIEVYSKHLNHYYRGDISSYYKADPPYYENVQVEGSPATPIYDDTGRASSNIPHYDEAFVRNICVTNDVTGLGGKDRTFGLCISQEIFGTSMQSYIGDIISFIKWDSVKGHFIVNKQVYDPLKLSIW